MSQRARQRVADTPAPSRSTKQSRSAAGSQPQLGGVDAPRSEALLLLQRQVGNHVLARSRPWSNHGVRPSQVQRAGDYSGLLPGHQALGGSYQVGNSTKTDFTYHHIVPENELHKAIDRLRRILLNSEGLHTSEEGRNLVASTSQLVGNARHIWTQTRVVNLTAVINREFSDYGVSLSPDSLTNVISEERELEPLFARVADVVQTRLRTVWNAKALLFNAQIKALFADTGFTRAWELGTDLIAFVQDHVSEVKVGSQLAVPVADVLAVIARHPYRNPRTGRTSLGTVSSEFKELMNTAWWKRFYTSLSDLHSSASHGSTLRALVKQHGLPNADHGPMDQASDDGLPELTDSLAWLPGNIHRGPKSDLRLGPGDQAHFHELLDDGGDSFEKAAVNLVDAGHFGSLERLNAQVDQLNSLPLLDQDPVQIDDQTLGLATSMVRSMLAIQRRGVTDFEPANWESIRVGNKDKMRLVENKGRILESAATSREIHDAAVRQQIDGIQDVPQPQP